MPVTNVPTPGSPIRSNWAQSVSNVANAAETAIPLRVAKGGDTMTGNLNVGNAAGDTTVGATVDTRGLVSFTTSTDQGRNLVLTKTGTPATDVGQIFAQFRRVATIVGSITIASATTVAYNTTSDRRLKERTGDVDDAAAIVQQLGALAYRGRWIGDEGQGKEWVFVNSQDVEEVAPFAVHGAPDGVTDDGEIEPQQLDHAALVPLLLAALAQALDRIDALEGTN